MATVRETLTEELRRQPVRQTSRVTDIDASTISRVVNGERQLSGAAVDVLAAHFGYQLVRADGQPVETKKPAGHRKKKPTRRRSAAAS